MVAVAEGCPPPR